MTDEAHPSGNRTNVDDVRQRLRVVSCETENRTRIDISNPDYAQIMRQMEPVMAESGMFYCFAESLVIAEKFEAPPALLTAIDDEGNRTIEPVVYTAPVMPSKYYLREKLCDLFTFCRTLGTGLRDSQPPIELAQQIIDRHGKGMPVMKAVVDYPVVGIDGKLVAETDVFDPNFGVYHAVPDHLEIETFSDPHAAYRFLRYDWLGEFPFKTEGDFWRALCYPMALLMRKTLLVNGEGNPIHIFTAPASSSGKTALAKALYAAVVGRSLPVNIAEFKDASELRKSLFAIALSSAPSVLFDNAQRGVPIRSKALEAASTSDMMKDRILGASRDASASMLTIIAITGNAISAGGDMPNRSLTTTLSPSTRNPAMRKYRKNIQEWTLANRGKILGALQCFIDLPLKAENIPSGRFQKWNLYAGSKIVAAAKMNGFNGELFDEWLDDAEGEGLKDAEINALCEKMQSVGFDRFFCGELIKYCPDELAALLGIEPEEGMTTAEALQDIGAGTLSRRLKVFEDYVSDRFKFASDKARNPDTRKSATSFRPEEVPD